jgi:type IV secretory pathway VirB2 component (pilin)
VTKEMNCCTRKPEAAQSDSVATTVQRIRSWALSPQGLTIAGIAIVAIGLALNWNWLVAVGAAPLILSLAPCAAMCALGLCMSMRNGSHAPAGNPGLGSETEVPSSPSQ